MKTFEELEQDVIAWADNLGIFAKSDPVSQMLKTASEVGELCDDINKGRLEDAKVELGDVIVTLILQCKMHNTSISVVLNRESWYDNVEEMHENCTRDGDSIKEWSLDLLKELAEIGQDIILSRDIKYNINDTIISCVKIAQLLDSTATECLQLAYDKISKRTGKMENGVFIREGDDGK